MSISLFCLYFKLGGGNIRLPAPLPPQLVLRNVLVAETRGIRRLASCCIHTEGRSQEINVSSAAAFAFSSCRKPLLR